MFKFPREIEGIIRDYSDVRTRAVLDDNLEKLPTEAEEMATLLYSSVNWDAIYKYIRNRRDLLNTDKIHVIYYTLNNTVVGYEVTQKNPLKILPLVLFYERPRGRIYDARLEYNTRAMDAFHNFYKRPFKHQTTL